MTSQAKSGKPATHPAERIFVGCSGWAYASWKPGFYPAGVPAKKFLNYYASHLNSVEVNYTFRALPTEKMIAGWLEATTPEATISDATISDATIPEATIPGANPLPPGSPAKPTGFRFTFKAPQRITHILRLKDTAADLDAFLASLEPVRAAGRLGALLFQLPPNFKADLDRLAAFLDICPRGHRIAFEFRHQSWFEAPALTSLTALLRKHKAALCVAESDELTTPELATAPFACYRLRRSSYTAAELDAIRTRLLARAQQLDSKGEVYAYFRHDEEPDGALRAVRVLEGLATA